LRERIEWLEDEHEVKIALDKDKADILLTLSSIEMMKHPDSVVAMAKILNHADVSWTLSTKGYEARMPPSMECVRRSCRSRAYQAANPSAIVITNPLATTSIIFHLTFSP
jgi:hypothetical protein